MNKYLKLAICAALPIAVAAGCNSFLTGTDVTKNPNNPTIGSATNGQLFMSVQVNNWQYEEGDLARLVGMWMQQVRGVARQALGIYGQYTSVNEGTYDAEFQRPYVGGGLTDIRTLESGARAAGDSVFLGVAEILEAWMIGVTADIWGDIPYTQANQPTTFPTPKLDSQAVVYDSVQSLLSQAITHLSQAGAGPGDLDFVYNGDPTAWTALAHTLKARYYLHTAEKLGAPSYASALTEAQQGIQSNTGDYTAFHSGNKVFESNDWFQFMDPNGGTGRAGDIIGALPPPAPQAPMYLLMNAAADPRTLTYYDPTNSATGMNSDRLSPTFSQPFVTYNENLLIMAEAQYQAGNAGTALATLNQERAAWAASWTPPCGGCAPWHNPISLAPVNAAGAAILTAIMTEKYFTLFQNIEVWNDYKRTCVPALTPTGGAAAIPGRLYYGVTERQTNPNIPAVGAQPARNWNDPNPCT